ncbi:NADPH:adrenodoxin oxidoreductase, mitochondrial isoform X2 [Zootermopsis nevadensis]|uniref:NADPH:adrenodoxin oxidoreductase, mitochondrial isoform X2 n=1 Tax=Zootermopsis nevadensis TaxID=136037 RepID=UPI000B8EC262|nr:NADPH:adrenodoxin oxidoreductase, mitochondrial isoform X2 [Zootermopsis nevadensis]
MRQLLLWVGHTCNRLRILPQKRFSSSAASTPKICIVGSGPASFYAAQHLIKAYGADEDQELGVNGEKLSNVLSARRFVGWYNGLPRDTDLPVDLNVEEVAVLGQGNVALDVARILLTPIDRLKNTDITEHALEALSRSRVRRVRLIGRRGPLQVAFTIKELREMLALPDCITVCKLQDFEAVRPLVPGLERPRRRLTELLCKAADSSPSGDLDESKRHFHLVFFRSPLSFYPSPDVPHAVGSMKLVVNQLDGQQQAVPTAITETVQCGLVLRSIGYRSTQADPALPFDTGRGRVPNISGVVHPGLYVAGWLATGPVGVILSTMTQAFGVGRAVEADVCSGRVDASQARPGHTAVAKLLSDRGVTTVSWKDWERVDAVERSRGEKVGKPREKIVDVQEMLAVSVGAGGT